MTTKWTLGAVGVASSVNGGSMLPVTVMGVTTRYRCTACGNLTRFDVVETTSTRSFHHFTVGGDLSVEEPEVIAKSVESVSCRWCGHGRGVEVLTESS